MQNPTSTCQPLPIKTSQRSDGFRQMGFLVHGVCTWILTATSLLPIITAAQSADWSQSVYHEPQVRYLLADLRMGGNPDLYRKYATVENDPDSREAIRLFDAGVMVVNTNEFERKWIANSHGKDGKVVRIVFRGSNRTITGNEVLLTSDLSYQQGPMRVILASLTLGCPVSDYAAKKEDPTVAEALRRWHAGIRVANSHWFEINAQDGRRHVVYRGGHQPIDGAWVKLNSDLAYSETNVRYFMADIALGGSIEFYRHAAEKDHEVSCAEAVRRVEEGWQIINLEQFERKKVAGRTLITRKGSDDRISGMIVKLSSD